MQLAKFSKLHFPPQLTERVIQIGGTSAQTLPKWDCICLRSLPFEQLLRQVLAAAAAGSCRVCMQENIFTIGAQCGALHSHAVPTLGAFSGQGMCICFIDVSLPKKVSKQGPCFIEARTLLRRLRLQWRRP